MDEGRDNNESALCVCFVVFSFFFLQILNDNKHNKGGRLLCVDAGTKEERINI
jgi:hypothetical protein